VYTAGDCFTQALSAVRTQGGPNRCVYEGRKDLRLVNKALQETTYSSAKE
jgi:hypothetical protein